jgi:hypothetical protein
MRQAEQQIKAADGDDKVIQGITKWHRTMKRDMEEAQEKYVDDRESLILQ